jgi:GNAT superfamily N-acetyltransferase
VSAEPAAAVTVREPAPGDVGLLLGMIRELAEYEKLADQVRTTEELLARALFGEVPAAGALIADLDGEPVGYAIYFSTFSTFLAIQGIWLEDLYVRPQHRKAGAGKALLAAVAAKLRERGGERLEWAALDWNELALGFYRGLGARLMDGWTSLRLDGDALARLAAESGDRR